MRRTNSKEGKADDVLDYVSIHRTLGKTMQYVKNFNIVFKIQT